MNEHDEHGNDDEEPGRGVARAGEMGREEMEMRGESELWKRGREKEREE